MEFIKRNYSGVSLIGAILVGLIFFFINFRESKNELIDQVTQTMDVVTNVKSELLDSKIQTAEQQLNLLSKNDKLKNLLSSPLQFDQYVKDILYSQGYTRLLFVRPSGEVMYTSNPGDATVPAEVLRFSKLPANGKDSDISIVLSQKAPFPFYVCKQLVEADGSVRGTVFLEVPTEFLSIELYNTVSMDSLTSYLVSSAGIIDHLGKVVADTCIACRWGEGRFIRSSPKAKIRGTWKVLSVYPVSQVDLQHVTYASALDGLIAFFVATGIVMVIIYGVQTLQKSKGITHGDIMLVQTTWNAVSEYSNKIIAGFYRYLFEDAPEVKPMFRSAPAEQEKRMALMINTIVNSADSLQEFKGSIAQLAKRHVHMGVKRQYFPIVVKAIISSVEDQYGTGFTPAHKRAWYKILNEVSAIMLEEMESYQRTLRETISENEADPIVVE